MNKKEIIMKLFTVGPVQMFDETLDIASKQLPYFRDQKFSDMMLQMEKELKMLLHLKQGKVVFLTGSGSAAMESVVACCFQSHHKVLIINGGSFGDRFVKLCACYHIPYDEIKVPFPQAFSEDMLKNIDGTQYDALLVNIHETSTGQLYPIDVLSAFAKKHGLYFIVDAISSFLSDPFDMECYGIDCAILSSQKALACSPGISMLAFTDTFYEKMIEPKDDTCMYLSIKTHVENMKRGQTPNTPAVGILLELAQRIHQINICGVDQVILETKKKAMYFREQVQALPVNIPKYPLSHTLTPIILPDHNAEEVYQYLKDKANIYVTPNGGELKHKMLRIGHLGNLCLEDYDILLRYLKEALA